MKRRTTTVLMAACLALAALPTAHAAEALGEGPYNEAADARVDINQAVAKAGAEHKQVLVIYGANWCKDCLALNRGMGQGSLSHEVNKRFVVVKVNVGRFDRNVDVANQMGVTLKKGIPTVAVLSPEGQVLGATLGGELADARNMGEDAVLQVLAKLGKT
ncbi:thioredoxin family protein [Roseateles terrae]|uniref:Thioredoxin-like negative regulator of GroEL n=1 Tax=Roseateles terrae TaxID=431060 RepID=A0ABR6GVX7_9BURK|nr:thioredoxin family protein [Roseateles terrae]MBB3195389.1 thioredoxin-like negative regulator of GroEL [Roseateles terrae]